MNTDFAQPGIQVAVLTDRLHGGSTVEIHTVERRTETQIVLDNGTRYRVRDGKPLGDIHSSREIRPYNDPRVVDVRARQIAQAVVKAITASASPHPQEAPFTRATLFPALNGLHEIAALVDAAILQVEDIRDNFLNDTIPAPAPVTDGEGE